MICDEHLLEEYGVQVAAKPIRMKKSDRIAALIKMLAKRFGGYRKVPTTDTGSAVDVLLDTPRDSDCENSSVIDVSEIKEFTNGCVAKVSAFLFSLRTRVDF